jgi:hypothetical protein
VSTFEKAVSRALLASFALEELHETLVQAGIQIPSLDELETRARLKATAWFDARDEDENHEDSPPEQG